MERAPILRHRAVIVAAVACMLTLGALAFGTHAVHADYQGPDENTSQAYGPLQGGYTYTATLNQGGSNPNDQDWYYYYVPTAGDRLHWTVSNTNSLSACPPYQCNVYATLEDSNGQQLGGGGSSAGTSGAAPGMTQTIDWTFQSPGKYYIAFVGDGPRIGYKFSVTPASGVSGSLPGSGGGSSSLNLRAHQAGRDVDFSLVVPSGGGSVDATLFATLGRSSFLAGSLHASHVQAGARHYAIRLDKRAWTALKKHHRLSVTLRVTSTPPGGQRLHASRTLVLTH